MPKYDEPIRLSSDEQILLKAEQRVMFQQCCDCGLTHRVEIEGNKGDLWFRHVNIGNRFPDDVEIVNVVRQV